MTLDPRFICSGDIESFFVDKLTALPLAAGVINFYVDGTNTPKSVYMLTGTPGTYAFVSIGDTMTLNSAGEYQYGGNPIVIYYFPYHCTVDGDPTTSTGVAELYSIAVFNSGGTQQSTRNAWPPLATNLTPSSNATDVINYIPNGQFLYYNAPNQVSAAFNDTNHTKNGLIIAQGGWTFQQTTGSTGSYTITFTQAPNGISGLLDFPINLVEVVCNTAGNETVHDLCISWPNVNTFSKQGGVNSFNLLFAANSVPNTTVNFGLYLTSYFGSSGSATVETLITTIPITHGFNYYNTIINFPDNSAKTVSAGSYVTLSLRTPSGQTCDVQFTDFALVQGSTALTNFPVMSDAQMLDEGIAGWMPIPDPGGMDLYLPLVLTPQGMTFDHSIVGQIIGKTETKANAVNNELLMDGSSFVFANYSSLGIPYARLGNYLLANSPGLTAPGGSAINAGGIPLYGTGANFVSIWLNSTAGKFDLNFNTSSGSNTVSDGTSGFTHTSADPLYVFTIPGVPTAGTYFTFTPAASGLVFNVWFTVNGAGTAPTAPTGANILVALVTADTIATTRLKIQNAINQYQFAILNTVGYFWRGLDPGGTVDPDVATRLANISYNGSQIITPSLGTYEGSQFTSHTHTLDGVNGVAQAPAFLSALGTSTAREANIPVGSSGGAETRPVNIALNWFIKY